MCTHGYLQGGKAEEVTPEGTGDGSGAEVSFLI